MGCSASKPTGGNGNADDGDVNYDSEAYYLKNFVPPRTEGAEGNPSLAEATVGTTIEVNRIDAGLERNWDRGGITNVNIDKMRGTRYTIEFVCGTIQTLDLTRLQWRIIEPSDSETEMEEHPDDNNNKEDEAEDEDDNGDYAPNAGHAANSAESPIGSSSDEQLELN